MVGRKVARDGSYDCEGVGHGWLTAGRGTEYDWLRFWWDMTTDEGITPRDLAEIYVDICPTNWSIARSDSGMLVLTSTGHAQVLDAPIKILSTGGDGTLRIATIGDYDGDGQADLAVGDTFQREVRVYLGPLRERAYTREHADVILIGDPGSVAFPSTLAAGDLDGDGRDDLLIGDVGDLQGDRAGKIYVVPGGGL